MDFTTLDYALLLIFVLAAFTGFKRGFLASLGAIFSTLAALLIAYQYQGLLAQYLEETYGLLTLISGVLIDKFPALTTMQEVQEQLNHMGQMALPDSLSSTGTIAAVPYSEHLANILLTVLSFLLLFISISMLLKLIFSLLNHLFNYGAFGFLNRLAGMLLETVKYAIIVAILLLVLNPLLQACSEIGFNWAETTSKTIEKSIVAGKLNETADLIQYVFWTSE